MYRTTRHPLQQRHCGKLIVVGTPPSTPYSTHAQTHNHEAAIAPLTAAAPTEEELWRRAERARRFAFEAAAAASARGQPPPPHTQDAAARGGGGKGRRSDDAGAEEDGWKDGAALVGTCRVVERDYTRTVDPADVRPVAVLEEVRGRVELS